MNVKTGEILKSAICIIAGALLLCLCNTPVALASDETLSPGYADEAIPESFDRDGGGYDPATLNDIDDNLGPQPEDAEEDYEWILPGGLVATPSDDDDILPDPDDLEVEVPEDHEYGPGWFYTADDGWYYVPGDEDLDAEAEDPDQNDNGVDDLDELHGDSDGDGIEDGVDVDPDNPEVDDWFVPEGDGEDHDADDDGIPNELEIDDDADGVRDWEDPEPVGPPDDENGNGIPDVDEIGEEIVT